MTRIITSVMILAAAAFILNGCAPKKAIWGSMKKGLNLTYRMDQEKTYTYQVTGDVTQTLTINGQSFDVIMKSYEEISLKPASADANPLVLDALVDSLWMHIKTPMKAIDADVSNAVDKKIQVTWSDRGIPLNVKEAESLYYTLGPEERNLSPDFQTLFPKLPVAPVLTGDTWKYADTLTEKQDENWLLLIGANTATLEGFETIGIRECARIAVDVTGTVNGEGMMQGIKTKTEGTYKGKDVYWFDYQKGLMVKYLSEGTASTTTKTSGEREMTIPAKRTYKKAITLVH